MPEDTKTIIENALAAPRRVKADGVDVEQQPLSDQLAAARYLDGKSAAANIKRRSLGIRLVKLAPPGGD